MGAGNKLDPTSFKVADIYKTSVCPLAKVMRRELKKRGIKKLKCVYSTEEALQITDDKTDKETVTDNNENDLQSEDKKSVRKKKAPGSVAFVPSVAGLIIAGEVVKDLI